MGVQGPSRRNNLNGRGQKAPSLAKTARRMRVGCRKRRQRLGCAVALPLSMDFCATVLNYQLAQQRNTWPLFWRFRGQLIDAIFWLPLAQGTTILLAVIQSQLVDWTDFSFLVGIPTMLGPRGMADFQSHIHHPLRGPP